MAEMDLEQYDAPTRGGGGRVRPRAAGRAALRALVARLAWTDLPLVYWTGRASPDGPIADTVQDRLSGLPAGLYAMRVTSAPSDEKRDAVRLARLASVAVDDPVAVTSATIARSVRALAETRGFPKLLPITVGDADAWRAGCEAALQRARSAIDAAARGEPVAPICLVLGRGTIPPSRHPLGWPTDVLAEAERRVGAARLLRLARTVPGATDAASAVRGRLLVDPRSLGAFLDALPELTALHERLADEPVRRLRATVAIQGEAITAALGTAAAGGPILLVGHGRADFEAAYRKRYQASVTDAVHRYYTAALPAASVRRSVPFRTPAEPRHGRVNVLGLLTDLFLARGLRAVMLAGEVPADRRRYLRSSRVDGQSVAAGPDGQPLRFETLAASAAAALWADVMAGPRRTLSADTVLDAAAAGAIPLAVPWTWVETCCHVWPPGTTGLGPATAVLASLDTVRRHAADVPAALDRFAGPVLAHALMGLQLLGDHHRTRRRERLDGEVRTLCKCLSAGLSADEIASFIELGAMDLLRHAADAFADQLLAIGRRFSGYLTDWSAGTADPRAVIEGWRLTSHWATGWCRAFDVLGGTLLDRFVRGVGSVQPPGETAALVYRLAWDLHEAPAERRRAQRAILSAAVPLVMERLAAAAGAPARAAIVEQFCGALAAADAASAAGLPAGVEARDLFAAMFTAGKTGAFLNHLEHHEQVAMAALAMGQVDRLTALSRLPGDAAANGGVSAADAAHVGAGWAFLRGLDEGLAQAVSAAVGREPITLRAVRAVARLGLCLRFHRGDDLRVALAKCLPTTGGPDDLVAELLRWRGDLPGRVREAMERPAALRRELDGLERKVDLSDSAARRVEHLRGQLADSAALAAWVQRDLAKVLPAALDEARVARLEATADGAIRGHFRDVLGVRLPAGLSPAAQRKWDNALRLYLTVDRNRTRLRWLLRRESRGDRAWLATEPRNAAFLAAVARAGVKVAAWRGALVRHAADGAGRPLRIELETDPLHVLQMGNYFGTCLSEGNMNAFSTVANATDANKRVVYVYDGRGTVVGRKLLVMTASGQIVGFRTYGSSDGPDAPDVDRSAAERDHNHLKRLLDAFCGELARLCGATLHRCDGAGVEEPASEEMRLAAEWYNDGAEPFDLRHTVRPVGRSGIPRKGNLARAR